MKKASKFFLVPSLGHGMDNYGRYRASVLMYSDVLHHTGRITTEFSSRMLR